MLTTCWSGTPSRSASTRQRTAGSPSSNHCRSSKPRGSTQPSSVAPISVSTTGRAARGPADAELNSGGSLTLTRVLLPAPLLPPCRGVGPLRSGVGPSGSREPMRVEVRRRGMARSTSRHRKVSLLVTALMLTGCGSKAATQETSDEGPRSTPFSVYTHCGVENVLINGRWWHAKPPLYNPDRTGPPAGWGDPHQEGTLTMESADRAVFEALDQRVMFLPARDDAPVRVCR